MSAIKKIRKMFAPIPGMDASFEHYYGALVRHNTQGVPSAAEARRDFQRIRGTMDKMFIL